MNEAAWYLVHTKPQSEETAAANLDRQGYDVFLPRTRRSIRHAGRWRERIDALFPRYLFLYLDAGEQNWRPIHSTVGVSQLVRFGTWPACVPDPLIDELRLRADTNGIVTNEQPAELEPGQSVRVTEGPLTGIEGIVAAKNGRDRVEVLLAVIGQSARTRLSTGQVARIGA